MASNVTDTGIIELLNMLELNELQKLALLTTENCAVSDNIKTKSGAINIILKYSENIETILSRKMLKKEILFTYLANKNVNLHPPFTKIKLVQKILEIFGESRAGSDVSKKETQVSSNSEQNSSINVMALKFSEWFYSLLNSEEGVGTEHFWNDAVLHVVMKGEDTNEILVENNVEDVIQCMNNVKKQNNLFFNPNLTSDGCRGQKNEHGLVLVCSCGTLINNYVSFGVYEQLFLLLADPFCDNNWKIKKTKLILRKLFGKTQHSLADSEISLDLCAIDKV